MILTVPVLVMVLQVKMQILLVIVALHPVMLSVWVVRQVIRPVFRIVLVSGVERQPIIITIMIMMAMAKQERIMGIYVQLPLQQVL